MGVYPFMFGATKDFEPIVSELVEVRYIRPDSSESLLMKTVEKDVRAVRLGFVCRDLLSNSPRTCEKSGGGGEGGRKREGLGVVSV